MSELKLTSPPQPAAPTTGAPGTPQLLLVDDEPAVLRTLARALPPGGLGVRVAAGGQEAVEVYRQHWRSIDLVLLDVLMPDMDGLATLAALREINPAVRCCFMSGQTTRCPVHKLLALGAVDILLKPFGDLGELRRTLRELALAVPRP